jgi:putative endopeptidase
MVGLVDNLVEAFRRSLRRRCRGWGRTPGREALAKLGQFTPKIGYPQRWRDYGGLEVRADDLLGNVRRAVAFETDRQSPSSAARSTATSGS